MHPKSRLPTLRMLLMLIVIAVLGSIFAFDSEGRIITYDDTASSGSQFVRNTAYL